MKKKLDREKDDKLKKENQDLKDQKEKDKSSNDFKSWFYNIGLKS
jgi:hypothetical protein